MWPSAASGYTPAFERRAEARDARAYSTVRAVPLAVEPEGDAVGADDVPFGWPDEFVAAVFAYADTGRFPTTERKRLRYRETDRYVEQRARLQLSVSADRIAVTANALREPARKAR